MIHRVYIGWDSREPEAADVCAHSILKHSSIPVEIVYLKQQDLRDQGLYTRPVDPKASTEFSLTRFLVPHLNNYQGWAVFVDCDFLFVDDIAKLFALADPKCAVQVVQHDYRPTQTIKMDGKQQHQYPRKNWSSMILWNCAHQVNAKVTLEYVDRATPSQLHQFAWIPQIKTEWLGTIPLVWNWLVGWYHEPQHGKPSAIHYTEGGPWFPEYVGCEYGGLWLQEYQTIQKHPISEESSAVIGQLFEIVPAPTEKLIRNIVKYQVDPAGIYHGVTFDQVIQQLKDLVKHSVAAIDADPEDFKYKEKGKVFDPILQSFALGAGGRISSWAREEQSATPVVLRGITKRKEMATCRAQGRDFYYIDTGYFGNVRKKLYHRVTKNDVQWFGPVVERSRDRLAATGVQFKKFYGGKHILLAPPSQKLLNLYDINLEDWLTQTQEEIRKYTDRPIVLRTKQSRSVRVSTDTMAMALERDVHCLVTFSSIAAGEALMNGKPAITLGPNAAAPLCSQSLSEIENPKIPTLDEVTAWAAHLSYCQFTEPEMRDGTAWRILNGG
jgi:lipopolysaccharide biosynthesis glycosyltransferase